MKKLLYSVLFSIVFCLPTTKVETSPITTIQIQDTVKILTIFDYVEEYCELYNVPQELVIDMGNSESRWLNPKNLDYIISCYDKNEPSNGDLQILDATWQHWATKLGLKEKTRINLLHVGIRYLKYQHDRYGNWTQARFAYGRGSWRPSYTWKPIEKRFMSKTDWTKFD